MANTLEIQTLRDTTQHAVIKLIGMFDGSGQESNTGRIVAGSLYGALDNVGRIMLSATSTNVALPAYKLDVTRIEYNVNMPTTTNGFVRLFWNGAAASNGTIAALNFAGSFGNDHSEQIVNPLLPIPAIAGAGGGGIGISTVGAVAGSSYTIILELRKYNEVFDHGQARDPAAFNFAPYNLRP